MELRKAALGVGLLLAGCSYSLQMGEPPPEPITCKAGPDCDAKWSRAISWITTNSYWKIQSQTDQLIQTSNSVGSTPHPSFTVTKLAKENGIYEITFAGACDNSIGCDPTVAESRASFARFVLAAQ
jgi:hypothetical protein